jgi:hypothetical protein
MSERSRNRAQMERLVGRWRASGQTLSGFARQHGVTRDRLQYWGRTLKSAPWGRAARPEPSLVPVRLVGGAAERERALEVVLSSGDRVLAGLDVPLETLRGVIAILRERC